jgi:hypothetical protein
MRQQSLMIYFLHVSKCAGSSFIALARRNARLFQPNANGNPINPITGDRLKFWRWTPKEQHYFLSSPVWDLVANENQLGPRMKFLEGVSYVTVLREPIDRLFSAWQFAVEKPGKEEPLEERGRKYAQFLRTGGLQWRRNYLLSTITYQERRDGRERLAVAKQRLEQFDHVFLMDSLAADVGAMAREGWTHLDLPWRNTAAPGEVSWSAARAALSDYPDVLRDLIGENKEDIELYDFACELVATRKTEPINLTRELAGRREMPDSDDFEFLVCCAYEAYLQNNESGCTELLARAEKHPDATDVDIRKNKTFGEFALRRFGAPERGLKEHRRKSRAKKEQARAEAAQQRQPAISPVDGE